MNPIDECHHQTFPTLTSQIATALRFASGHERRVVRRQRIASRLEALRINEQAWAGLRFQYFAFHASTLCKRGRMTEGLNVWKL